ncbi:hypothetical protein F2P79_020892 [Pimephales promelas]|nr:hypothetical protein F2P79_020890 [Pimephales promelas]KAG1932911.1 hypothetical protein F2P79_020892 [Pimephales promelas]
MDLVQEIILQTEYHLNQAQVEANLARKTAENLSRSSTRSARYAYTWWNWTFRGCVLASGIIFFVTLCRCCYFRCLIRTMRTSTNVAIALSPLKGSFRHSNLTNLLPPAVLCKGKINTSAASGKIVSFLQQQNRQNKKTTPVLLLWEMPQ